MRGFGPKLAQPRPLALLGMALALPALAGAAADSAQSPLAACAAITSVSERLNCYDQLAGRPVPSPAATPAPVASAPASAAATAPAVATPTVAAPVSAAPESKNAFGLYTAEHPVAPLAPNLEARVLAIGTSPAGRQMVTLEGGQLWELDDEDRALFVGDEVTIRRAALGSFLLDTPAKRTHRVHRVR